MNSIQNFEKVALQYRNGLVQKENCERIYSYLLSVEKTKVQPMAQELHMSVQRCTSMLQKLQTLGLVERTEIDTGRTIEVPAYPWEIRSKEIPTKNGKKLKRIFDVYYFAVR